MILKASKERITPLQLRKSGPEFQQTLRAQLECSALKEAINRPWLQGQPPSWFLLLHGAPSQTFPNHLSSPEVSDGPHKCNISMKRTIGKVRSMEISRHRLLFHMTQSFNFMSVQWVLFQAQSSFSLSQWTCTYHGQKACLLLLSECIFSHIYLCKATTPIKLSLAAGKNNFSGKD